MITAIIVDDDKNCIDTLNAFLSRYCTSVQVVGMASTVSDAKLLIHAKKPELVFLDVELQGETGFDLLAEFTSPDFQVIFQTAHEHYALKAIKSSCIEYLLKPINKDDLVNAITKVESHQKVVFNTRNLEMLMENIRNTSKSPSKIAVPSADGYVFINVDDIVYCKADNNYSIIHTAKNERIVSTKTLKDFEEILNDDVFFRCHKSFLINLNYIKRYSRNDGFRVLMANDEWIDISVRKRDEFLKIFEKF